MEEKRYKNCTLCKQNLPIESFYTNGKTAKGTIKYKGRCKHCEGEFNRKSYLDKLSSVVGELKCSSCGYDKCLQALEFHHPDPSVKESSISNMKTLSLARIEKEVSKCVLLCANCHREAHYLT